MNLQKGISYSQKGAETPSSTALMENSTQDRSCSIALNRLASQVRRINRQELLAGAAYSQQTQNHTSVVQKLDGIGELRRNGDLPSNFLYRNGGMNIDAYSGIHALNNEDDCWNTSWSDIMEMIQVQPETYVNDMSRSINNMNNFCLMSNAHSRGDSSGLQYHHTTSLMPSNHNYLKDNQQSNFTCIPQTIQNECTGKYQPLYHMNSPLRTGKGFSSITNSYPFAPGTPQQVQKLGNQPYMMTVDSNTDKHWCQEKTENRSIITTVKENTRTKFQEWIETADNSSIVTLGSQSKEIDEHKGGTNDVSLNKTPPLKPPKRKKHRPKVVIEDMPKRNRKLMDPKNADTERKILPKRKYVHKNGPKPKCSPQGDVIQDNTTLCTQQRSNTCRRSLNFGMETERVPHEDKLLQQEVIKHKLPGLVLPISDSEKIERSTISSDMNKANSSQQINQTNIYVMATNGIASLPIPCETISHTSTDNIHIPTPPQMLTAATKMRDLQTGRSHTTNTGKGELYQGQGSAIYHYMPANQPSASGHHHVSLNEGTTQYNLQRIREKILQIATHEKVPGSYLSGSKREHLNQSNSCAESNPRTLKKNRVENGHYLTIASTIQSCDHVESGRKQLLKSQGLLVLPNHFAEVERLANSNSQNAYPGVGGLTGKHNYDPATKNNQKHQLPSDMFSQLQKLMKNRGKLSNQSHETNPSLTAEKNTSVQHWIINNKTLIRSSGEGNIDSSQNSQSDASGNIHNGKTITLESNRCQTDLEYKHRKEVSIDDITNQLEILNLNACNSEKLINEEGTIVVYRGDGAIVPYGDTYPLQRRKPQPKVDLDPETNRLWRLLMSKEGNKDDHELDDDKAKWWEQERSMFHGRTESFIAKMHLIQGDRRFSRWKGSVVDSVIGVFLTQNVTDHLSSSAFMSLAARFPVKSKSQEFTTETFYNISPSEPFNLNCNSSSHSNTTEADSWPIEAISSQDSAGSPIFQASEGMQSCVTPNLRGHCATDEHESIDAFKSTLSILQEIEKFMLSDLPSEAPRTILTKETSKSKQELRAIGKYEQPSRINRSFIEDPFPFHLNSPTTSDSQLSGVHSPGMFIKQSMTLPPSSLTGNTLELRTRNDRVVERKDYRTSLHPTRQIWHKETPTTNSYPPHCQFPVDLSSSMQRIENHNHFNFLNERDTMSDCSSTSTPDYLERRHFSTAQSVPYNLVATPKIERNIFLAERTHPRSELHEINPDEQMSPLNVASSRSDTRVLLANDERTEGKKQIAFDWDNLRKKVQLEGKRKKRSIDNMDSMDYENIRNADVDEISNVIKERGMNNMLAARIKNFLNRLVEDHGSIDLEWLRDAPPDKAKDYLLSVKGLGLKSVECVRLLTLHHLAFPVDTNVGRIAVRLGWVPLQPLPESLHLHLLEMYPVLESIQKYLWPRLCKLDQRTLYELHYQLITFGKVFCTKSKPNCNACPMRGECRHFASANASARLSLPGPDEKTTIASAAPIKPNAVHLIAANHITVQPLDNIPSGQASTEHRHQYCEPIIEEPATPEPGSPEFSENDIEDALYDDPEEIPTIKLNAEEVTLNLQSFMQENMGLQEGDLSRALVALDPIAASDPTSKLKNVSRLRTEHQVYELPDGHPLLKEQEKREPDDPSPYLLAIWMPGETHNSTQQPTLSCKCQELGILCSAATCFSCNSMQESNLKNVKGTILIPCRTAMRGSFPLNGTYFQVNEVFADHISSLKPLDVPRAWLWNLPRRTIYFGTSVSSIFKGMETEEIQHCFWRGFVCVRGFDRKTRAPRPLVARLHFPASKTDRSKKTDSNKKEIR